MGIIEKVVENAQSKLSKKGRSKLTVDEIWSVFEELGFDEATLKEIRNRMSELDNEDKVSLADQKDKQKKILYNSNGWSFRETR